MRTQQDVEIVDSILRMLSVSGGQGSRDVFTAPVGSQPAVAAPSNAGPTRGTRKGYEYWKQRTLAAIDADDGDNHTDSSHDDEGSGAESVLTDPDIHVASTKDTTPLAGLKPQPPHEDEDDMEQYNRSLKANQAKQPAPSTSTAPTTTSASETILQSDRATHEALSSELLRMASVLKSNSVAFADSLERDRLLLEKAGTDLGQNLDLMTRTRGRLGVYSKKARGMGWFTLSAILVVVVSWMIMFLLIRLT
uniref:t-SNARE coiled-coil homology domain-containing protein n=2 Tax=Kalmanozyma brasiliensis (strain GHG001) TaxID=1365824 RepID=V5EAB0_KALBG